MVLRYYYEPVNIWKMKAVPTLWIKLRIFVIFPKMCKLAKIFLYMNSFRYTRIEPFSNIYFLIYRYVFHLGNLFGVTSIIWDGVHLTSKVCRSKWLLCKCICTFSVYTLHPIFLIWQVTQCQTTVCSMEHLSGFIFLITYKIYVSLVLSLFIFQPHETSSFLNMMLHYLRKYYGTYHMI